MKKILMIFALMMGIMTVNAQTAIETPKFFDNWYVGVGGQATTPLDFNKVFPLNGGVAVTIGKQFTPVFGANVENDVWFGSHANGTHLYGVPHFDTMDDHNVVRGNYLGVNGTLNLMNLFGGYKGVPRTFEVQAVAGIGWWHVFTPNASDRSNNDLGAKTGANLLFNLGKTKAHTVYVQPAVLWNLTNPGCTHNHVAFNKMGAQLSIQVGYVYHFKTSNGTHYFKTYDVGVMQDEINRLRQELDKKPNEVEKVVVKEVKVPEYVQDKVVVFFAYDSDELTDDAKATLDKVAGTVCITATASPEGNAEYNKALSQRRADAVKAYLEGRNVKVEKADGLGVQGNTSARIGVVEIK